MKRRAWDKAQSTDTNRSWFPHSSSINHQTPRTHHLFAREPLNKPDYPSNTLKTAVGCGPSLQAFTLILESTQLELNGGP